MRHIVMLKVNPAFFKANRQPGQPLTDEEACSKPDGYNRYRSVGIRPHKND